MTDERPIVPGAEVNHETIHGDGVDLHVAAAGPEDGDPVLLLHGFPDFWFGWRHQIPALVGAGYRVYAPDLRGVNGSDAPEGVSLYGIDDLAGDALAVIDAAGGGPVEVVGHDWGGGVAWWLATEYPERVGRVVGVNAPHPVAMERRVLRDPLQALRSSYFAAFAVPEAPERLLEAADWRLTWEILTSGARQEAFGDAELYDYRRAWDRTDAASLLAPYRAALRDPPVPHEPHVAPPAAIMWGLDDPAFSPAIVDDTADLCADATTVRFSGAGHWLHREAPEDVNDLLVRLLDGEDRRENASESSARTGATADAAGETGGAGTAESESESESESGATGGTDSDGGNSTAAVTADDDGADEERAEAGPE